LGGAQRCAAMPRDLMSAMSLMGRVGRGRRRQGRASVQEDGVFSGSGNESPAPNAPDTDDNVARRRRRARARTPQVTLDCPSDDSEHIQPVIVSSESPSSSESESVEASGDRSRGLSPASHGTTESRPHTPRSQVDQDLDDLPTSGSGSSEVSSFDSDGTLPEVSVDTSESPSAPPRLSSPNSTLFRSEKATESTTKAGGRANASGPREAVSETATSADSRHTGSPDYGGELARLQESLRQQAEDVATQLGVLREQQDVLQRKLQSLEAPQRGTPQPPATTSPVVRQKAVASNAAVGSTSPFAVRKRAPPSKAASDSSDDSGGYVEDDELSEELLQEDFGDDDELEEELELEFEDSEGGEEYASDFSSDFEESDEDPNSDDADESEAEEYTEDWESGDAEGSENAEGDDWEGEDEDDEDEDEEWDEDQYDDWEESSTSRANPASADLRELTNAVQLLTSELRGMQGPFTPSIPSSSMLMTASLSEPLGTLERDIKFDSTIAGTGRLDAFAAVQQSAELVRAKIAAVQLSRDAVSAQPLLSETTQSSKTGHSQHAGTDTTRRRYTTLERTKKVSWPHTQRCG
jgi:hypothetical protein